MDIPPGMHDDRMGFTQLTSYHLQVGSHCVRYSNKHGEDFSILKSLSL